MAVGTIVRQVIIRGGKEVEVFRRGNRFVSRSAFRSQQWRMRGGKAGTLARANRQKGIESYLRAQLGAPPAGKSWFQIASKYAERFADYLADMDQ